MSLRFFIILLVLASGSSSLQRVYNFSSALQKMNLGKLNGAHLKFAVTHFPPFNVLSLQNDGNYTDTGSTPMSIAWLAEKLNFTVSYEHIPTGMAETKYRNMGDIAILLRLISEKKVDGSSRFIIETWQRKQFADFAYFIWAEPIAMVVPRPGEEPRLFAFIWPFQPSVWLLIFITICATVAVMTLFSRHYTAFVIDRYNNLSKINDLLETRKYVFPYSKIFCDYFVAKQFNEKEKSTGKCNFKTTDPVSITTFWPMPLQKNSKFTPVFKHALITLWETGLPQFWVRNSVSRAPKCFAKIKPRVTAERKVPIQLKDLSGAFLILGIGYILGTLAFLLENIYHFNVRMA